MLSPEARDSLGFLKRHTSIGVAAMVVHEPTYRATGEVLLAVGKENVERRINWEDKRVGKDTPKAPRLQGQEGVFMETITPIHEKAGNDVIRHALLRTIGDARSPGEEVGGIDWNSDHEEIMKWYLGTLWFAHDEKIPVGEENTACAFFIVWDRSNPSHLQRGYHHDKRDVRYVSLDSVINDDSLKHARGVRQAVTGAVFLSKISMDPALESVVKKFLANPNLPANKLIDLGAVTWRPGNPQMVEVLRAAIPPLEKAEEFLEHPGRFFIPRIYEKLLYCPYFDLYKSYTA